MCLPGLCGRRLTPSSSDYFQKRYHQYQHNELNRENLQETDADFGGINNHIKNNCAINLVKGYQLNIKIGLYIDIKFLFDQLDHIFEPPIGFHQKIEYAVFGRFTDIVRVA